MNLEKLEFLEILKDLIKTLKSQRNNPEALLSIEKLITNKELSKIDKKRIEELLTNTIKTDRDSYTVATCAIALYLFYDNLSVFNTLYKLANMGCPMSRLFVGCGFLHGILNKQNEDNFSVAFQFFKASASASLHATLYLGGCYKNGWGTKPDAKLALEYLNKASNAGISIAACQLGICFEEGKIVPKDLKKAQDYYQIAAKEGNSHANYLLGQFFQERSDVPQNLDIAIQFFQKAIDLRCLDACVDLGNIYLKIKQIAEARRIFTIAVEDGHLRAQYNLGLCYEVEQGPENEKLAFEWMNRSANQGDPRAQFKLGLFFQKGIGTEKDLSKAVLWLERSAAQNHPLAQFNLGLCHEFGIGVPINDSLAFSYYQKAAIQNNDLALYKVGLFFESGVIVQQDKKKAYEYFHKAAAAANNSDAQMKLGVCSQQGIGCPIDLKAALRWTKLSADQNNPQALYNLGIFYYDGIEIPSDKHAAFNFFQRSADQGNHEAQYRMGHMLELGIGTEQDKKKAFEYYYKAAEGNHSEAQLKVGVFLQQGIGTSIDLKSALHWTKRSAEQNNYMALHNLGVMYLEGLGVTPDHTYAFNCFKRAADHNNSYALFMLGTCFCLGRGTHKDFKVGIELLKRAAIAGHNEAQQTLGECLLWGKDCLKKDQTEAVKWFTEAAKGGMVAAQRKLGFCYREGFGVSKDRKLAFEYFSQAAKNNCARSQHELAEFYYSGDIVSQNYQEAMRLYKLAADQGMCESALSVAIGYQQGLGVQQDFQQSIYWFKKAASLGSMVAAATLSDHYREGLFVTKNLQQSRRYLELSKQLKSKNHRTKGYVKDLHQNFNLLKQQHQHSLKLQAQQLEQSILQSNYALFEQSFKLLKLNKDQKNRLYQIACQVNVANPQNQDSQLILRQLFVENLFEDLKSKFRDSFSEGEVLKKYLHHLCSMFFSFKSKIDGSYNLIFNLNIFNTQSQFKEIIEKFRYSINLSFCKADLEPFIRKMLYLENKLKRSLNEKDLKSMLWEVIAKQAIKSLDKLNKQAADIKAASENVEIVPDENGVLLEKRLEKVYAMTAECTSLSSKSDIHFKIISSCYQEICSVVEASFKSLNGAQLEPKHKSEFENRLKTFLQSAMQFYKHASEQRSIKITNGVDQVSLKSKDDILQDLKGGSFVDAELKIAKLEMVRFNLLESCRKIEVVFNDIQTCLEDLRITSKTIAAQKREQISKDAAKKEEQAAKEIALQQQAMALQLRSEKELEKIEARKKRREAHFAARAAKKEEREKWAALQVAKSKHDIWLKNEEERLKKEGAAKGSLDSIDPNVFKDLERRFRKIRLPYNPVDMISAQMTVIDIFKQTDNSLMQLLSLPKLDDASAPHHILTHTVAMIYSIATHFEIMRQTRGLTPLPKALTTHWRHVFYHGEYFEYDYSDVTNSLDRKMLHHKLMTQYHAVYECGKKVLDFLMAVKDKKNTLNGSEDETALLKMINSDLLTSLYDYQIPPIPTSAISKKNILSFSRLLTLLSDEQSEMPPLLFKEAHHFAKAILSASFTNLYDHYKYEKDFSFYKRLAARFREAGNKSRHVAPLAPPVAFTAGASLLVNPISTVRTANNVQTAGPGAGPGSVNNELFLERKRQFDSRRSAQLAAENKGAGKSLIAEDSKASKASVGAKTDAAPVASVNVGTGAGAAAGAGAGVAAGAGAAVGVANAANVAAAAASTNNTTKSKKKRKKKKA